MRAPVGIDLQPVHVDRPPPGGGPTWRVHVYAHTHWDREWYRTFERFRMQLVGVVDRLLDVLDGDPDFTTFVLDGQSIVLEDYLAIRPEEEPRLRRLIGAGRIEVGPWYVLPDEFLVSGESLVRNLLEGRRVASRFGPPLSVGYLPDPFGHVSQLPAVLRGFGIDNVIFSRGMGDEHPRIGDVFRWESPGGADVLAVYQGSPYTSGYCNAELLGRGYGPDDQAAYDAVRELVPELVRHASVDALLLAAGCDHDTIQEQLPVIVARIAELLPDCEVRIGGLDGFVAGIRAGERRLVEQGGSLARHRGELRGSRHRPILASIFSARIHLKQDNDRVQSLLERHVEPLMAVATAAGVRPRRDVTPFLRHAWRLALENHPHDSIGGCSVDEVHAEMPSRTMRAEATALGLVEDLRIALQLGDVPVVHDAWGRGGIVERPDGAAHAIGPGRPGVLVPLERCEVAGGARVVDADAIASCDLTVRVAGTEPGAGGPWLEVGGVLLDLVDEADAGDEYDFGQVSGDEPRLAQLVSWTTSMAGPGVAQLDVHYRLDLPVALDDARAARSDELRPHEIRVRVRVSDVTPLAHVVLEFDNQARDHRLRVRASGVDAAGPSSVVEALGHFDQPARPVRPPSTQVPWRQVPPGLDHCAGAVRMTPVNETGSYPGILLAGRGLHEYEARPLANSHALELTVLRSVGWLSRDDVAGRPGHAGPAIATPDAQCLGPIRVELALGVGASFDDARAFLAPPLLLEPFGVGQAQHGTQGVDGGVERESGATARARDVLRLAPRDAGARIDALGLVVDGERVVVSAMKLADDDSGDLVVRWWAPPGGPPGRARLRLACPVRAVHRARLDESTLGPAPWVDGSCELTVAAGEIATVRVALER